MRPRTTYCHFTKAIENLGERWTLLILGELVQWGPHGFNALVDALPGISRSVLAERLKRLEEFGLVARDAVVSGRAPGYRVTAAGEQLRPVLMELNNWSERWVPEDPAVAERDPDLLVWWIAHRIAPDAVPSTRVVMDIDIRGTGSKRWLVLEPGQGASACPTDPMLGPDHYVFIEATPEALQPVARGLRSWSAAIADGSIHVSGAPALVRALPDWFAADLGAVAAL